MYMYMQYLSASLVGLACIVSNGINVQGSPCYNIHV